MACRAPDDFYISMQLQEITQCSPQQAEQLLVEKKDLMLAVEEFFAREVRVKPKKDESKAGDVDDIITIRPKLKKKYLKPMGDNKPSLEDIYVEQELLEEVVAISIADVYPTLQLNTIMFLVRF